jgi:ParB-like chromosome segregation protein Spo0J
MKKRAKKQPLDAIEWVPRNSVTPNEYNPNAQAPPEFKLLKISILSDGWTQPIVVFDDGSGETPVIVDGEHRWRVSGDPEVSSLTGGMIPIVRVRGTLNARMMSTVRHNRARGEHGILPMSRIVRDLIDSGESPEDVSFLMQMEPEEVQRLAERAGLPEVTARMREAFSSGWIPGDD